MLVQGIVSDVIDDLASRQALSGAASATYIVLFIGGWWLWVRRVRARRLDVETVVLVTGSRGKSSTVRALHAALLAAGRPTYAKTTGTAAAEIDIDGSETSTRRIGQVSILEVLHIMSKALRGERKPRSLVFECMAVRPNLISVIANDMLRPNVAIITNAQVDHLEDEGSSLEEIATSMAEAITPGSLVITGETQPEPLAAIRKIAERRGARFVQASPNDLPLNSGDRLPFVHPQNVTFVLNVTRSLAIDDEVAIDGMARASKEPGEFEIWRRSIDDVEITYADFGAINDPLSMLAALDNFEWPLPRRIPRIALVTGRWDRPYRDLSFIGCLETAAFDGLVLSGGPVRMMSRELIRAGWSPDRVVVSPSRDRYEVFRNQRLLELIRHIDFSAERAMIVALQNEHEVVADGLRSFFHEGSLVRDRVWDDGRT